MNTGQTVYEQLQEIYEIYEKIGCYIQHGGAIKGGGWKVYDPISLVRVLSALGEKYRYVHGIIGVINSHSQEDSFDRKLLTDTGSDAYLDDQSDDTIEALHKLLVRK